MTDIYISYRCFEGYLVPTLLMGEEFSYLVNISLRSKAGRQISEF